MNRESRVSNDGIAADSPIRAQAATHDAHATLNAWRASGADRVDPVRFCYLDAMARRAAALDGLARQRLDEKLATLMAAYASRMATLDRDAGQSTRADGGADVRAADTNGNADASADTVHTLADLIDYLADPDAPGGKSGWTRDALGLRAAYPDVQMLDYFRGVWAQVSADRQVRQSQERVHKNAGPLNSNQLVHRALTLMRELSPGYLQQFLSYTDALMWMEQIHAATAPPPKAATPKKASRGKAR